MSHNYPNCNNCCCGYSNYWNSCCNCSNNCCYYPTVSYNYENCIPTPTPINNCPVVSYETYIASSTSIVSGGTSIPVGTIILPTSTTVPVNTVTVINGYTGAPTVNIGGVLPNNGFFTVPITGRYVITANICFSSVTTTTTSDVREVYIYKSAANTGLVTLLAVDSRNPISGSSTCINVATEADLAISDRIFVAVRQTNANSSVINTDPGTGRFTITRIC